MSTFDLIVSGAEVLPGAPDAASVRADVGVRGGRIAALGDLGGAEAAERLDAGGLVVAPGFIDAHTHAERVLLQPGRHRYGPAAMGVTTVLSGADGFGWVGVPEEVRGALWESTRFAHGEPPAPDVAACADPAAYLASMQGALPVNVVPQAPHQAIRAGVLGWDPRPAVAEERRAMQRALEAWFEAGAVGLGTGLDYQPGANADAAEMTALAEVCAAHGGVIAAHLRYAALGQAAAWRELMALSSATGARVHVSHEVVNDVTRPLLEACDVDGIDLTFEAYLYPAGCTHLSMMLPLPAQEGGPAATLARLRDPGQRAALAAVLGRAVVAARAAGERIELIATPSGEDVGLELTSLLDASGPDAVGARAISLLETHQPYALCLYHRGWSESLREATFDATATHPRLLVASDGVYHGQHGHPRGYGTFPRFLRRNVRERGLLTLAQAVYRLSGAVAERFGIPDRGAIRAGAAADMVVFDLRTIADAATFETPFEPPVGIAATIVGGQVVWRRGAPTGALPGVVIGRG